LLDFAALKSNKERESSEEITLLNLGLGSRVPGLLGFILNLVLLRKKGDKFNLAL